MNYEEMSNYEINKEVSKYWGVISKHLNLEDTEITLNDENETVYVMSENGVFEWLPVTYFDPCKNPNDAWPIIVDNNIEITPNFNGMWTASCIKVYTFEEEPVYDNDLCQSDKNPLRAAMICFLKMKDAEK